MSRHLPVPNNMIEAIERLATIMGDAGNGEKLKELWGLTRGWPYVVIKNLERLESGVDLFTYTMTVTEGETAIIALEASGADMAVKSFEANCRFVFMDALLLHLFVEAENDGYPNIYILRELYDATGIYSTMFARYRFKKVTKAVMMARVPQRDMPTD